MPSDSTISGLPETTNPASSVLVPVVESGVTKKAAASNLVKAFPVATGSEKGLMSATDKTNLTQALADIAALQADPTVETIASSATITIASGTDVVVLTGTTNVTTVNTPSAYKVFIIHYPTGAGLTFMGTALTAGNAILAIGVPA